MEHILESFTNGQFNQAKSQIVDHGIETALTDYIDFLDTEHFFYAEDRLNELQRFCRAYQSIIAGE